MRDPWRGGEKVAGGIRKVVLRLPADPRGLPPVVAALNAAESLNSLVLVCPPGLSGYELGLTGLCLHQGDHGEPPSVELQCPAAGQALGKIRVVVREDVFVHATGADVSLAGATVEYVDGQGRQVRACPLGRAGGWPGDGALWG